MTHTGSPLMARFVTAMTAPPSLRRLRKTNLPEPAQLPGPQAVDLCLDGSVGALAARSFELLSKRIGGLSEMLRCGQQREPGGGGRVGGGFSHRTLHTGRPPFCATPSYDFENSFG